MAALKAVGARLSPALGWNLILDGQLLVVWRRDGVTIDAPYTVELVDGQYVRQIAFSDAHPIGDAADPDQAVQGVERELLHPSLA